MKQLPATDAALVALLLAANPAGLRGVALRSLASDERHDWLQAHRRLLPADAPWLKIPVNVSDDRLLGGLDFAATVSSKRPVFASGLLEAANGGVLVLSMAERLRSSAASIIGDTLDRGRLLIERDGVHRECETRFTVVALDEGLDEDETLAASLAERLAFRLSSTDLQALDDSLDGWSSSDVIAARRNLGSVRISATLVEQICQSAQAFGVGSLRGDLFMLQAARTAAALDGKESVSDDHAAIAARLVLSHRATRAPVEPEAPPPEPEAGEQSEQSPAEQLMPEDVLVDAVLAALPPDLLDRLAESARQPRQRSAGGRGGPATRSRLRGRPVGVEASRQVNEARLNVLATLKAAAPWQAIRRRARSSDGLEIRPADLHVTRYEDRVETTTIFVVDASGSQAAQRLAEVKGAIELLLNDCYVRRDQVALIAFRKDTAEVLLQPTRALARVKRSLSALPGGGGTPLAAGLDSARQMADGILRQGRIPSVVLMTDGRANIARDLTARPELAERDAMDAAKLFRATGLKALLVDTSRRPRPRAKTLAEAMGAGYVPLPNADAAKISGTVQRNLAS